MRLNSTRLVHKPAGIESSRPLSSSVLPHGCSRLQQTAGTRFSANCLPHVILWYLQPWNNHSCACFGQARRFRNGGLLVPVLRGCSCQRPALSSYRLLLAYGNVCPERLWVVLRMQACAARLFMLVCDVCKDEKSFA